MATEATTRAGQSEKEMGVAGVAVKEGIVNSIQSIEHVQGEIVNLVRQTVSSALKATGAVVEESVGVIRDVLKGAVAATEEIGVGSRRPPKMWQRESSWGSATREAIWSSRQAELRLC